MNKKQKSKLNQKWNKVAELLPGENPETQQLEKLALQLSNFATAAESQKKVSLAEGADLLSRLAEVAARWKTRYPDDTSMVSEWTDYITGHASLLEQGIESNKVDGEINAMVELADQTWSEYFMIADGEQLDNDPWAIDDEQPEEDDVDSGHEIEMLLSAFSAKPSADKETQEEFKKPKSKESAAGKEADDFNAAAKAKQKGDSSADADGNAREELMADRELLEAYLDDSLRCVDQMEKAALALDSNPADKESIRAFCRELHTLKGASATVGLSGLATRLHDLETSLEEVFSQKSGNVDADKLFEAIDFVRSEMDNLQPQQSSSETTSSQPDTENTAAATGATNISSSAQVAPRQSKIGSFTSNDDSSVRIRASQLDRLMDMLAELVVLRNRRESTANEYELFYSELSRCAARLGIQQQGTATNNATTLGEVSKDIEAVSQGLRDLQKPVANDNVSITRFIRDFRQELMQLRRVPVSGMFSRLQRAARDAAKSENKKVRVLVAGEDTGLEQEIQERLYESLLHIVRNSVSHGVESPEKRTAASKDETGTVTLEASSSAQLLLIEVRDDGNGVNYEAIRKRAIEKGLIGPQEKVTNAELANLIFHPGFSTKETASEISGRGVGMDVVATTLQQLKGRIEVESVTGQGTTIRLLIPLRTGIEHVMVFRTDDQLFALPMRSVTAAKATNKGLGKVTRLALTGTGNKRSSGNGEVLVLNSMSGESQSIALEVDQLIGPEEVVVRGLPGLIQSHPLFSGITLSGSGEKVLLLESEKVAQYCTDDFASQTQNETDNRGGTRRALVVDDSLTARKMLAKLLHPLGFTTVEAGDGIEAIEQLQRESFDIVFTDLDMPRLGGMELLADIQSGNYCDAPVVVVTSRSDDTFKSQALDNGAASYLTKPISKEAVSKQLEQLEMLTANS